MFQNILAATLGNLARNRLYAAISILSLAIGMAVAILTGLYIRDELSFDRFIPGYRNVSVVVVDLRPPGRPAIVTDMTLPALAKALKSEFKGVQASARLWPLSTGVGRGDVTTIESIAWVDPDFFSVLPLPAVAGDPAAAVRRPDGVAITRRMARKIFGEDRPLGQILEVNRVTKLRVEAVLEDIPSTTHLGQEIFASGLNAISPLRPSNDRPIVRGRFSLSFRNYVRLDTPQRALEINRALPAFVANKITQPDGTLFSGSRVSLTLVPLSRLHLYPLTGLSTAKPQGSESAVAALGLIAALVLVMGGINFVNLMTARAARRAIEVGVRKAAGATRGDLILQFIGEAMLYALAALVLAVGVAELALPHLRTRLDSPLDFHYWREPASLGLGVALCLLVGLLAGAYPAVVQSSFRPANVLKGALPGAAGSTGVRAGLATLQFAFLIGLILAVMVIGLQTRYALNEGLRVDKAQMVTMDISFAGPLGPRCRDAFPDQVRRLPGVKGAACSSMTALDVSDQPMSVEQPDGAHLLLTTGHVDQGFFELYGLKPVAGRFFSKQHPEDELPSTYPLAPRTVVINETAARTLGFPTAAAAVGRRFRIAQYMDLAASDPEIVGVAPDYAFDLVSHGIRPMVYVAWPPQLDTLNIKLTGKDMPGTLRSIDALWKASGSTRPPVRRFVDDYLQSVYANALRQGWLITVLSIVAVVVAGMGLFGLASFTAERRTKEIGVRKAMGASSPDIVRMLLWAFSRPVLWANLIAWPAGWWALNLWLQGFARRIDIQPWLFVAAGAAALLIAALTVSAHAIRVARAKPVGALRYE